MSNKVEHKNKTYQCIKGKWYCLGERRPEMDNVLDKLYKAKRFSAKESSFNGFPMLEIMEYNEPYNSPYDEHFRFGIEKAKMIVNCFSFLEDFANSGGVSKDLKVATPYVVKGKYTITKFNEFKGRYGRTVEEPYIKIEYKNRSIGIGIKKARILLQIESDISKFTKINQQ